MIQWRLVEKIADRLSINVICNNWDSYDVNTEILEDTSLGVKYIYFSYTQILSKGKKMLTMSQVPP